jgi:4-hydroxy-2-oxoglutarate aldolase
MAETPNLDGVFAPITTPFDSDGRLSITHLRDNITRYNLTPLDGYVVAGSTGEAILLTWAETEALWAATAEAADSRKLLIAGTAAESTAETIARTERAAQLGYQVALVRTPHYFKPQMTVDTLEHFFRRVADAAPIPILIYSIPQYTGVAVEADLVGRLSTHPNIAGIKDSSGSVERAAEMKLAAKGDFRILVGSASSLAWSVMLGASGGILALADVLPEGCAELYKLAKAGKAADGRDLQEKLLPASKTVVSKYGVAGAKYALDRLGYYGGPVREPLRPLSEVAKKEIDGVLAKLGTAASAG